MADRGICCDPKAFLQTALDLAQEPLALSPMAERASYEAWHSPFATPRDVKMEQVITHLSSVMPEDAIVTNGAGNYAAWLHRYYRYKSYRTQLAPTSRSMGYGLPAAVAAKLERPDQDVVCLAGDGCFQMGMQEFGRAVQYGTNIIVIASNNGVYGTTESINNVTIPIAHRAQI